MRGTRTNAHAVINGAIRGDPRDAASLVDRLLPVIRARVRRRLAYAGARYAEEADDLFQEVWHLLLRDEGRVLRAWQPERGASLENYVGLVAEREVGNHLTRWHARKRGGGLDPVDERALETVASNDDSPEVTATTRDLGNALWSHVTGALSSRCALVFQYVFVDHRDSAQVAKTLGIPTQAVYNCVRRAREIASAWLAAG